MESNSDLVEAARIGRVCRLQTDRSAFVCHRASSFCAEHDFLDSKSRDVGVRGST